jgi:hypothetical protein
MAALKVCMLLFTALFFAGHIELSAALKVRGVRGGMRQGHRSGDRVFAHVCGAVRHLLRALMPSVDGIVDGLKQNKLLLT